MRPSDLNYQHLRYFRAVAHEGSVLGASRVLHLAPSTVSGQIKTLEQQLGGQLLERSGRSLVLTEFGRTVLRYADQIFELGDDLVRTAVLGERRERLRVGVSSVIPKLLVREVLRPALSPEVELYIEHGLPEDLFGTLASRRLDVVLSDSGKPPWLGSHGTEHLVVETGIAVFGSSSITGDISFPEGLEQVPWVVPPSGTSLRNGLEVWWDEAGIAPEIAAVVDDSALIKALGEAGFGVFAVPTIVKDAVLEAFDVIYLGSTNAVLERVYAVSRDAEPESKALVSILKTRHGEGPG